MSEEGIRDRSGAVGSLLTGSDVGALEQVPVRRSRQGFSGWLLRQGRGARGAFLSAWSDHMAKFGIVVLSLYIIAALIGPTLLTHGPFETLRTDDGSVARNLPPSREYLAGTNRLGHDLFTQVIHGARMAMVVGLVAASVGAVIGTLVGLVSGYFGGVIDQVLMRLTDIALAIPFVPFALVFLALFGPGLRNIIILLGLLFWRGTARVVRSQVLTLKERPYIQAARAAGSGNVRIMLVHILPNLLPLIFLYVALGVGGAVSAEAALSFLGFGDPRIPTWGQTMNMAFASGAMRSAWWWVVVPGLALTFFVTAIYLVSRGYEEAVNPRLRRM